MNKTWEQYKTGYLMTTDSDSGVQMANYLWNIKDSLVNSSSGAWTVVASSNSVTASAADNWSSVSDVVRGTTDTAARSWILLQSPAGTHGPFYLLVDYCSSGGFYASIYFSKNQPDITTLKVHLRPPATGPEFGYVDAPIGSSFSGESTHLFTSMVADDGSFIVMWSLSLDLTLAISNFFMFNVLSGTRPSDPYPAACVYWQNRSSGSMNQVDLPDFKSLLPNGLSVDLSGVVLAISYNTTSVDKIPYAINDDVAYNKISGSPVWLFSSTAGKITIKGVLEDVFWAPNTYCEEFCGYEGENLRATKCGCFWVPIEEPPRL